MSRSSSRRALSLASSRHERLDRGAQLGQRVAQPVDGGPLMTMAEAGDYLRYRGKNAADSAYRFLRRHHAHMSRRDACWLVRKGVVDALLESLAVGGDLVARARALQGGR